jgi:hypothetical protein
VCTSLDPEAVEAQTAARQVYDTLSPFTGSGLVTADGESARILVATCDAVGAEHTRQMQIIRVDNAAPPRGAGSPTSSAASAAAEHILTCIAMWLMTVVEVLPASEDDMLRFLRQRAAGVVAESVAAVASIDNEDDGADAAVLRPRR